MSWRQGANQLLVSTNRSTPGGLVRAVRDRNLASMLRRLPQMYSRNAPPSHPGYDRFVVLAGCSNLFSSASSIVATATLLASFFDGAQVLGWLMKDMVPNLLAVFAANTLPPPDEDPPKHLVAAQATAQAAPLLDVAVSTLVSGWALPYAAATSSFLRGTTMLKVGAARASMLQNFAMGNMGQLQQRLQSAMLVSYSLGSVTGGALVAVLSADIATRVAVVSVLSFLSVALLAASTATYVPRTLTPLVLVRLIRLWCETQHVPTPEEFQKMKLPAPLPITVCPSIAGVDVPVKLLDVVARSDGSRVAVSAWPTSAAKHGLAVHVADGATLSQVAAGCLVAVEAVVNLPRNAEHERHRPAAAVAPDAVLVPSSKDVDRGVELAGHCANSGWCVDVELCHARRLAFSDKHVVS